MLHCVEILGRSFRWHKCAFTTKSTLTIVFGDGFRLAASLASSAVQRYNHSFVPERCP